MSTITAPSIKRAVLRSWLPWLIVVLGGVGIGAVWAWPGDLPPDQRRFFSLIFGSATVFFLIVWFALLSAFSWLVVGVVLGLLTVSPVAAIRKVEVSGKASFWPTITWRWEKLHDETVEEDRRKRGKPDTPAVPAFTTEDFPEYRGNAARDGISHGKPLNGDWSSRPPRQLWRSPIGGGYAAFAVAGNLAVTIEQRRDQEAVVGYDTESGRERWAHTYDAHFKETLGGAGPRATPTVADQDVYSLALPGRLVCLDAATGKEKWHVDILENNENIHWGMSGSPLVYDNLVVVNPGTQTDAAKGRAVVAYDRTTGKQVWAAGNAPAAYSSPMLATLAEKRQVLLLDGTGLSGYDAANGKELWRYPWETHQNINVAQPLVLEGDRVFISSAYGHGCAMLRIVEQDGRWSVKELWANQLLRCKFASPVLYQGYIYGLDEGILACVDAETGKRKWKDGRYGHGQLLRCDDLLVVLAENGRLALVEATPEGHRERGVIQALEDAKTWNLPALANGKVYLRNEKEMACYDLR